MSNLNTHTTVNLRDVTVKFPGRTLLRDVNASYGAGKLVTLIGRNGAGKSTLLKMIAALSNPTAGNIEIEGEDISHIPRQQLARKVSLVSTSRVRISNMTGRDIVALGRAPYTGWTGRLSSTDNRIIEESLSKTGMTDYASRPVDTLSDGELQRVMIARALAQDTPVMLLDEPTSFLDVPSRHQIIELLSRLSHTEGKCIIFSTHEIDIALRYCDTVSLIETPSMVTGPVDEVLSSGIINRVFNIGGYEFINL